MNGIARVLAPVEQVERVAVVVLHHVAPVGLHRVGAGALVQHRVRRSLVERAVADALDEVLLVEVVGDLAGRRGWRTFSARERLSTATMSRLAARVERLHEVGADEAGGAGDDQGHGSGARSEARVELGAAARRRCRACRRRCRRHGWRRASRRAGRRPPRPSARARRSRCRPRRSRRRPRAPRVGSCQVSRRGEERHALLAARDDQRLEVELGAQLAARGARGRASSSSGPPPRGTRSGWA